MKRKNSLSHRVGLVSFELTQAHDNGKRNGQLLVELVDSVCDVGHLVLHTVDIAL